MYYLETHLNGYLLKRIDDDIYFVSIPSFCSNWLKETGYDLINNITEFNKYARKATIKDLILILLKYKYQNSLWFRKELTLYISQNLTEEN